MKKQHTRELKTAGRNIFTLVLMLRLQLCILCLEKTALQSTRLKGPVEQRRDLFRWYAIPLASRLGWFTLKNDGSLFFKVIA